jgi:hypothetical protein
MCESEDETIGNGADNGDNSEEYNYRKYPINP